jgi:hypothetical protein
MRRGAIAAALALVAVAGGMSNHRASTSGGNPAAGGGGVHDVRPGGPAPAVFDPTRLPDPAPPREDQPGTAGCAVASDPQPAVREFTDPVTGVTVTKSTIVQISLPGCGPCVAFMAGGKDPYERVGWDVSEVKGPVPGVDRYPSYRILNRGEWYWHRGPLTPASLKAALRLAAVEVAQPVRQQYASAILGGSGRSWTQGGRPWAEASLRAHLYAENHRYPVGSLDQLGLWELERLHTADHEGRARSPTVAVSGFQSVMSAGCPTGGCPPRATSMQTVSRGILGVRWRR